MEPSRDIQNYRVRFGPFVVDLAAGEIREHGIRLKLQQQPFAVLEALLDRPGEAITREELHKRLWPDGVYVDYDRGLNKAVNRLREVLSDSADDPRYIETLPQRGYRFVGTVVRDHPTPEDLAPESPAHAPPSEPARRIIRRVHWALPVLAVVAAAGAAWIWQRTARSPQIQSIAVLPLQNLSSDPAQEFFSDGMTDELIGELAHIPSLHVISRTSVMGYKKATRAKLPEIARELGVDAIVEGTVTNAGGKVRITAQLIRASDDRHIWSQKYECELTDILRVQAEVARAIARQVNASLRPETQSRLTQPRAVRPDAYQALLQGNYFLQQNIRGIPTSMNWFRRALELDPELADAHAGLAQALIYAGIYEFRPFAEAYTEAREEALKALALDDGNAAAHNALADVKKGLEWDLAGAEREHRRALELSPSHLLTRLWLAETLSRLEHHDEALAESARAVSLDPVSALSHNNRAMLLWRARRYDEAIQEARKALELDPSHVNALWWQGLAHAGKREFATAEECLRKGYQMSRAPVFLGSLGYVLGLQGEAEKARGVLNELTILRRTRFVSAVNLATVHAGLADAGKTFGWLEKAAEERDGRVHQLVSPLFDRFRGDPRYADLKARIGLR